MNTKIAMSAMSIVASLAIMGGATFAFFSSSATSTENVFATGSLVLGLSDTDQFDQATVAASFGGTLAPGQCTGVQTLNLKNLGSVAANHAEVAVANTVTDNAPTATPDMSTYLEIQSLTYDAVDVLVQIPNSNGNGLFDLDDWELNSATVLDNLPLTDLGVNHPLAMNICLDESAPNEVQTDSVSSLFTVTWNQNVSQ